MVPPSLFPIWVAQAANNFLHCTCADTTHNLTVPSVEPAKIQVTTSFGEDVAV